MKKKTRDSKLITAVNGVQNNQQHSIWFWEKNLCVFVVISLVSYFYSIVNDLYCKQVNTCSWNKDL